MRFDCITLFPELLAPLREHGIGRRAFASGQAQLQCWNPRDFTEDAYRRVDDRTYGGGPGMVMMAEPLARTLAAIEDARAVDASVDVAAPGLRPRAPVVHFSPAGQRLDQAMVQRLAAGPGAVLVCGRYEGIDQRFVDRHVDWEVSLGDFVLSGGELPAMALIDAVVRLLPGVLGDPGSHEQDSFSEGLLDCPHYSRPEQWGGDPVPAVLLSGHHRAIAQWRREQSLRLTQTRRPDLIRAARAEGRLSKADEAFLRSLGPVEPVEASRHGSG